MQTQHALTLKKQIEERERLRRIEMSEYEKLLNKKVLEEISELKERNP